MEDYTPTLSEEERAARRAQRAEALAKSSRPVAAVSCSSSCLFVWS